MKADDCHVTDDEFDRCLQQFLLKYQVTFHRTTESIPADRFFNCKPTTILDKLRPNLQNKVERRVQIQRRVRLITGRKPIFNVGNRDYARYRYRSLRWRKPRTFVLPILFIKTCKSPMGLIDDTHRSFFTTARSERSKGRGCTISTSLPNQSYHKQCCLKLAYLRSKTSFAAPTPTELKSQMPNATSVAVSTEYTHASTPTTAPQMVAPCQRPRS